MKTVDKPRDQHVSQSVQGLCASCGARCCKPVLTGKNRNLLYLQTGDAAHLEKVGLGVFILKNNFPQHESRQDEVLYSIVPHIFGYCPLLDLQASTCTIYTQRPRACRIYPYSLSEEYLTTLFEVSGEPLAALQYKETLEYGLTECLIHQQTPREEYLHQVNALLEEDMLQMESVHTLLKKDEEASLQSNYRQLHFFLIDQLFVETDPEIRQSLLEHQPQIPHILDNEDEKGSFLISGLIEIIESFFPPLLKLVEKYQVVTTQTPLYLYITLVGRVPPTHQDRFPGMQYIPLLQVRGIMGENQQGLPAEAILKKLRLQSRTSQQDGRFLRGILLYEDLVRDPSYWQTYWEELKLLFCNRKSTDNPAKRKKPKRTAAKKSPFRPRRRR